MIKMGLYLWLVTKFDAKFMGKTSMDSYDTAGPNPSQARYTQSTYLVQYRGQS